VISPLDHPGLGGGFGDPFASVPTIGGDALGGGWESQSSSLFVNGASLESSGEPSLPDDDDDEDNRPVAQSPLLRAKEKEREAANNVRPLPVPQHQNPPG